MALPLNVEKLKTIREKMGVTKAEAARLANLKSRQHYHMIESGASANITLATLDAIAKAFGVKAKDLLK